MGFLVQDFLSDVITPAQDYTADQVVLARAALEPVRLYIYDFSYYNRAVDGSLLSPPG